MLEAATDIPPRKVATAPEMWRHLCYLNAILPRLLDVYGSMRVHMWKFTKHICEQRAMDSLCNRLMAGKGKQCCWVVGAAECSSGWGLPSAPVKRVVRRMQSRCWVVIIDEPYTSQYCPCVFRKEKELHERTEVMRNATRRCRDGTHKEIYGVKYCGICKRYWNRDVSAALCQLELFWYMLHHGKKRPPAFAHRTARSADAAQN